MFDHQNLIYIYQALSSNTYGYDAVGNITRIKGVSESSYYQNYQYDDLSRLTNASGMSMEHDSDGGDVFSSYSMGTEYNIMSSPLLYDLTITTTSGTKFTKNEYLYNENQPGAPIKVGDTDYKYDASGNPVSMRGGDSDRTLKYDAENRLRVIEDTQNGTMSLYTYNHTGERSLKRYGAFNTAYLNGAYAGSGLDGLTRYSAYISSYYVEHGTGVNASNATKHYYIGTERLVSKLVTSVNKKDDVKEEENTYYYFTDHLGSTTHITDKGGNVVQYAAYTPYGTLFREYKSVMPYKFNGKELDQETGYYYYGARFYDPSAALWIGVDPLQYKYPDIGAYVYCAGNPVKYVDPDGRWIWENKNIQEARHYASDWGCSVRLVDGKYGKDAQIVNAHGDVIDTKPATAGNQHCAFVNIVNTLDEGGISHAGGTTYTTKQDVAVATGVIGVISGGMALEAAGTTAVGTAVTVAGMLNSADDIGTNTKGESFLQQQSTTETEKIS